MYIAYGTSRVGYSANYVEYVHAPDFGLVTPEDGAFPSSPPFFNWNGSFELYLFYSVFYYDLVYYKTYHPVHFFTLDTSFTLPSDWWEIVDGSMPSYWVVCGYEDDWECTEHRSFTKGISGVSGGLIGRTGP
jgi:hypothetical protein